MAQEQSLTAVIGFAAARHPKEMVAILTRNGVIVPTETLSTKMLVELIVNALAESNSFQDDFLTWVKGTDFANANGRYGPTLPDGSFVSGGDKGFDWSQFGKNVLDAGKLGMAWLQGRQQVAAADSLAAAEAARLEAARVAAETEEKSFASRLALTQASTTKVIVFGLLGLALIGGAIWYFSRKK